THICTLSLHDALPISDAARLVNLLAERDDDPQLIDYLEDVFEAFGVDSERHSEHSLVLHPSDHMRVPHFPGLPEDGVTVTFQRQQDRKSTRLNSSHVKISYA